MQSIAFEIIIAVIIAYLFGSISTAIVTCKLMGLPDPRKQGSGNPGATNVLRFGGKKAAIITLIGDMLKGMLPVLALKWYGLNTIGLSCVAFAAFLGHLYPIFFRFQGGKGVATAFGCLVSLSWPLGFGLLATWLVVAAISRYSSLAAVLAALLAPLYAWFMTNIPYTVTACLISALLIYRHRKNIQNLVTGKESKIGSR
ncbi:MAG TPA: glycerol-3-phosphate 1-O-acyltransferase PlsY [Gammaproteobacteria bacterium]|nr:glycerol-3-phosphate 1-O-acyltransferase PlsY [Gammaproteobacteria bacterium]